MCYPVLGNVLYLLCKAMSHSEIRKSAATVSNVITALCA